MEQGEETYEIKATLPRAMKVERTNPPMPDHGFKATFSSEVEYLWLNAEYAQPGSAEGVALLKDQFQSVFQEPCSKVRKQGGWLVGESSDKSKVLSMRLRKARTGETVLYELGLMTTQPDSAKRRTYFEVMSSVKFMTR